MCEFLLWIDSRIWVMNRCFAYQWFSCSCSYFKCTLNNVHSLAKKTLIWSTELRNLVGGIMIFVQHRKIVCVDITYVTQENFFLQQHLFGSLVRFILRTLFWDFNMLGHSCCSIDYYSAPFPPQLERQNKQRKYLLFSNWNAHITSVLF